VRLTRTPLHARLVAAVIAMMTVEALVFDTWPVVAVAAALSVLDGALRPSPFALVARAMASVSYPLRPDGPARRTSLVRAGALAIAAALLASGLLVAGVVVAVLVVLDAALDALTGWCLLSNGGQLRRRPAADVLGLPGAGPWLVGVSARECDLCERVVEVLADKSKEPVARVTIDDRPRAAGLVRVIPTALRLDADGVVRERLSGPRSPERIERFLGGAPAHSEAPEG
jgi:hypothetical protein